MSSWWNRLSALQRIGIVIVSVAVLIVIAGMLSGLQDGTGGGGKGDAGAPPPPTSPAATGTPKSHPAPQPTFTHTGDPQCAIAYADRGDGTMYWTVTTSVAGEVVTYADDKGGTVYRHDEQEGVGSVRFFADIPLTRISDVGGTLDTADGRHFGCSVQPAP